MVSLHLHLVDRRNRECGDVEETVDVVGRDRSAAGLAFFM